MAVSGRAGSGQIGGSTAAPTPNDAIRDLVDTALDSEDAAPLVRTVFDSSTAASARAGLPLEEQDSPEDDNNENAAEDGLASRAGISKGPASTSGQRPGVLVMTALQNIADEQANEIGHMCRSNADDIAKSIQEFGGIPAVAQALRDQMQDNDASLQEYGQSLLQRTDELQEHHRVQQALVEARQVMVQAVKLLQMCADAGHHVAENRLFKAFKLLERIKAQLESMQGLSAGDRAAGASDQGRAGHVQQRGKHASVLGRLQPFVLARIEELGATLEHRAISDFNNWLVTVRAQARTIGLRAVRRAAIERQRDTALSKQRKQLTGQLGGVIDLKQASLSVAKSIKVIGTSPAPPSPTKAAASGKKNSSTRVTGEDVDSDEDFLVGVDMTLLHRCTQIHQCLGRMQRFQDYYHSNRRLQLISDLTPPQQFMENYQNFTAQIVGFFLVEDRVQRSNQDAASPVQVDAGWESAIACLKTVLEGGFETVAAAALMLAVKDFMLLVCSSLGQCGYHVVPLQEILMSKRSKYHDLLGATVTAEIAQAVQTDALKQIRLDRSTLIDELVVTLGLPLQLDPAQRLPFTPDYAPFTNAVPQLVRLSHSYIEDSVAYLRGLVSPAEVLPVARQQRDRMLSKLVLEALQRQVEEFNSCGPQPLRDAMQLVTNAWCLMHSLLPMDDFTALIARGGSLDEVQAAQSHKSARHLTIHTKAAPRPGISAAGLIPAVRSQESGGRARGGPAAAQGKPGLQQQQAAGGEATTGGAGALSGFQALQESCERVVVRTMATQVVTLLGAARLQPWLPTEPPRTALGHSSYVQELIKYLQEALTLGGSMMPGEAYEHVARAIFGYMGDALMALLAEDAITAYNMYALFRLSDDIASIQTLADSLTLPNLREGLAEPQQFCDIMVTGRLEEFLQPGLRSQKYAAIEPQRLVTVLEKYREVGDKASYTGHHPFGKSRQPASFLKKRAVDTVAVKLRVQFKLE